MLFVLFAVFQNLKTFFQKQNLEDIRYSLKTPSKWFRLFHEIEEAELKLSGSTKTLQVPIEPNENIWCSLTNWCHAFMCGEYHCPLFRYTGLYTAKMKAEVTAVLNASHW